MQYRPSSIVSNMLSYKRRVTLLILFTTVSPQIGLAFNGNANFSALCENVRLQMIIENPSLQNATSLECRSTYSPNEPPAMSISIGVSDCLQQCPGYESSKIYHLNQWIGPLVGFLLPALAFVVQIPRPLRIPRKEEWFGIRKTKGIPWLVVAFFLTALDIANWIIVVFAFAGPMMAGSIYENAIDHYVLTFAQKAANAESARVAITFSLVGSLKPRAGDLMTRTADHIVGSPHAQAKLLALLDLLPTYGARVGVPIVFYLGAYAYALFEANSKIGDNDTAHAIAFGLWYGVVVLVAITSSSVLGIDNPASLDAVFSQEVYRQDPFTGTINVIPQTPRRMNSHSYHFHDSPFRMVWLWERARVFNDWTREHTLDEALQKRIEASTTRIISGLLACVLVALPCVGACWISYQTPGVGFGCRSVTHLVYATSQILLIMGW